MEAPKFLKKQFSKGIKLPVFAISLFVLIAGCLQTELDELEFFEVEINRKTWTEDYGTILLNGNISNLPNGALEDHGFIWSTDSEQINLGELISGQTISRGTKSDADAFSTEFPFPDPDETYFFRAFAKSGERLVFSENVEIVSLNYSLQILETTVSNNEIHLLGAISGIENRGKFLDYGYIYSSENSEPTFENDQVLSRDSVKIDIRNFKDTLQNLDFNMDYFIRPFGKNKDKIFYGAVDTVRVKDGWRQMPGVGRKTVAPFSVSVGNKGYVGFGCEDDVFLTSRISRELFVFEPQNDRGNWNTLSPNIPSFLSNFLASRNPVAFEIDNDLYAGTGFGKNVGASFHESRSFYKYNLSTGNEWIDLVTDPLPGEVRHSSIAFVLNNKAYIGTGKNRDNVLNDFYEFDPAKPNGEKWSSVDPMPLIRAVGTDTIITGGGREQAISFTHNNKGYVGLGRNGAFFFYDFWEFDPTRSRQWRFVGFFPGRARSAGVAFQIDDRAFFGTGFHPAVSDMNDFWEFNPATLEWIERTPFPGMKRSQAFGFPIGSEGYLGGGRSQALNANGTAFAPVYLNDFWQYIPEE